MNREIKFRAWHIGYKKMFKIGQITLEKGIWQYEPEEKEYIGVNIPSQPQFILMQSTGLKDKNGVEIYEGDIVVSILRLDNGIFLRRNTDAVEWNEETSSFMLGKKKRHFHNNLELEVIGNIYENPDLLKESEE